MDRLITEFIATFFLMLIITVGAVLNQAGTGLGGLCIGVGLVALVYAGGHVSKAHYNPAVSVAFLIRGGFTPKQFVGYLIAQFSGAILAALIGTKILGLGLGVDVADLEIGKAFVAEMLFTFLLVWVIMNVATSPGTEGNNFYGIAIGFTVMAAVYCVGDISLAVLNPAVAVGLSIAGKLAWSQLWLPVAASVVGAVLAVFAYRVSDSRSAE